MPESLSRSNRPTFNLRAANPFPHIRSACGHRKFSLFSIPLVFLYCGGYAYSTLVIFFSNRYGWSAGQIGAYIGICGMGVALMQVCTGWMDVWVDEWMGGWMLRLRFTWMD